MNLSDRQRLFKVLLLTDMIFIIAFLFFVVAGYRFLSFFVYPVALIKDFDAEFLARYLSVKFKINNFYVFNMN